ncbi:MAG: MoaD/ThiS family protein [Chloracidobacterium sp.]|uniref:Molybdopterin synthase sulfur carrier subunit n=1 Tax=Chloracidobacterium validum TaxID=2821543 RepID=A0ABX8B6D7_9BACT|nr:MoaD/ThiS family protein [Chloracidobacterium validum]QUW02191.1 MoaD/ThiS family protein [Chloracidobacterium validum]
MTPEPITLNVLVFGQCRALVGASVAPVQVVVPTTAAEVMAAVCRQYPQLAPLRGSLLVAVNEEYASAETPVKPGDDVAVFPPIAGG